ncbi:MarR family winged helix-turn-helix transcriptional regulator [Aeromicrobium sp. Leaf350]|uniref:MarR family winged helix-turn-helix transcriptional regulator n=1 Tax=Aeromicrobium sp. Leaf350 TaxID=2876565 RepID=UPI001E5A1020|nr:MarR family transcriptional regulator [Aeromicrobium sp. Leaf350]
MTTHPGGPPGAPDARLEVVRRLQSLTTATLHFTDRAAASRGLHRSDLQALQALVAARESGADAVTPGELSQALTLSPSATTTLIDRLERAGHVRRDHDQHDRRRVGLTMTKHAGTEARAMFGPMAMAMVEALSDFDDDQVATILAFLETATAVVTEANPG